MQIRWTLPATADLKNISSYIEKKSSLAIANKTCRVLYDSIQMLRAQIYLGKPGRRAGTRELIEGRYVIVYRIQSEVIEILRIWHAAQDRT
jgi:plasmid stabilization system protein ParE